MLLHTQRVLCCQRRQGYCVHKGNCTFNVNLTTKEIQKKCFQGKRKDMKMLECPHTKTQAHIFVPFTHVHIDSKIHKLLL